MKILFINSKDHWQNGWISEPESLEIMINVLRKAEMQVVVTEVENVEQLEKLLEDVSSDTLIWSNAYFVNAGTGKVVWINDFIEKRGLPFLGSNAQTLQYVLQKDACQSLLKESGLPIPSFTVVTSENISKMEAMIYENNIEFPMVLKPTAESGSKGVVMAKNMREAILQTQEILTNFPLSNVIIEEFLPSDDITCGFLQLGKEILLLPTYYIINNTSGKTDILSYQKRIQSWEGPHKIQTCISDEAILNQLTSHIPNIASALDIRGITRVDGRLDKDGVLRFFDVNGLPGLSFLDSVMVQQCFTCFPNYDKVAVFEGLIHTIVLHSLMHYGMAVPKVMQQHNLFTMESEAVIRVEQQGSR